MYENTPLPIVMNKQYDSPSIFTVESLLREARRQKRLDEGKIPDICILDPDGDIVQNLIETGKVQKNPFWSCYHTSLYQFSYQDRVYGIIGNAVGASFAVLVAEELSLPAASCLSA